jgi:glycosyltransferase involved in cell wall biosynthesis
LFGRIVKSPTWHVITSEYPPQPGGVSDYTQLVASELAAAGDEVHIWCPSPENLPEAMENGSENSEGVFVHRDFGCFAPADLRRVGRELDHFAGPRRVLVQWVPQGYGYRSINLPFCWWLWRRAQLQQDRVELMVHEPFLAFGEGSRKQDLAAAAHRLMVVILLRAASHIWVSIPDWETRLRPFVLGEDKSFGWLPVPSNIPVIHDPVGVKRIRAQYALPEAPLVGHFGAYDQYMTKLMLELLPRLVKGSEKLFVMLLGKGSLKLYDQLDDLHPNSAPFVRATDVLSAADVSRHISACDVMLQPYQDGVSGRRTSVMTALSHGVPVVTTVGKATESCWAESQGVTLTTVGDIDAMIGAARLLLTDPLERERLMLAGKVLYENHFEMTRTIAALRAAVA